MHNADQLARTTVDRIADVIRRSTLTYTDEVSLHVQISDALQRAGIYHVREAPLPGGRVDFLTLDGVAVEVKVAGARYDVIRQLNRYAASSPVNAVVLVTTVATHTALPDTLAGCPVRVVTLLGQAF